MGIGRKTDHVAGRLARVLHGFRGPKESTAADFGPYLDRTPAELFPEPPPLENVRVHGSFAERLLRTTTLSWQSRHEVLCPRYALRHEGEYRANATVWARWVRPDRTPRRRCLLYVHGWLEPGSWVEEALMFPRWTRELDADVMHVALPFHGPRNPRGALFSGEYFWTADLVRSLEGVRQAVHDVRAALGWLRCQGYAEVGAAGVSLGGSLTMVLACVDPTPDWIIPIVGHLRLGAAVEHATILWRMKEDLERFGLGPLARRTLFRRLGLDAYLPVLSPRDQLWIDARDDGHIDPALVTAQWEAWGRPNLHWIPGGHMTFPLHMAEITGAMREFLEARSGPGGRGG